jgi:hypothetical protein
MTDNAEPKVLPIVWQPDNTIEFGLATQMIVNFDDDLFYVRFYRVTPPIVTDTLPDSVTAEAVAGIVIPASKMPGVIEAMAENYAKYRSRIGVAEADDDHA